MSFIPWPRFQTIYSISFLFSGNENIFQININYIKVKKKNTLQLLYIQNTQCTFLGSVITGWKLNDIHQNFLFKMFRSYNFLKYQIVTVQLNIMTVLFLFMARIKNCAFTNYSVIDIKTRRHVKSQVLLSWNHPLLCLSLPQSHELYFSVKEWCV